VKSLIVLLALVVIGVSLLAPKELVLFPERPYHGAYGEGK
jgi:hypothetical protein